jgi:hypothetical protein
MFPYMRWRRSGCRDSGVLALEVMSLCAEGRGTVGGGVIVMASR